MKSPQTPNPDELPDSMCESSNNLRYSVSDNPIARRSRIRCFLLILVQSTSPTGSSGTTRSSRNGSVRKDTILQTLAPQKNGLEDFATTCLGNDFILWTDERQSNDLIGCSHGFEFERYTDSDEFILFT